MEKKENIFTPTKENTPSTQADKKQDEKKKIDVDETNRENFDKGEAEKAKKE